MKEIKNKHIFNIIVDIHPRNINGFFRSVSTYMYIRVVGIIKHKNVIYKCGKYTRSRQQII